MNFEATLYYVCIVQLLLQHTKKSDTNNLEGGGQGNCIT